MSELEPYIDIMFLSLEHDVVKLFEIDSPDKCIKHLWDKGIGTVVVK